jgi:MFS family permease
MVYMNMNTTLGVFLRDQHGVPDSGYGWLISINAAMVVLLQFPITRQIEKNPPMLMMAFGGFFVAFGLLLYGFVSTYWLFVIAMAILTIGEMITVPVANALVASFSPEEMRGRYNFIYGLSWGLSFAIGPWLAGQVMDHYDPNWLWYAWGQACLPFWTALHTKHTHRTNLINTRVNLSCTSLRKQWTILNRPPTQPD